MDLAAVGIVPVLFILVTIALGALIKGVTGVGLPIFAVPALAMLIPVEHAVIVMALPGVIANLWLVVVHREHLQLLKDHRAFLLLGFIGAIFGTWLLVNLNDVLLKALLATWLGIYLARHYFGRNFQRSKRPPGPSAGPVGFIAGAFQGAMGISAPLVAPYFYMHGFTGTAFAFAAAFTFALMAIAQLTAITGGQLFTPSLLAYTAMATLTTVAVIPIGVRLGASLRRESFDHIVPAVLVIIELKLLFDVASVI